MQRSTPSGSVPAPAGTTIDVAPFALDDAAATALLARLVARRTHLLVRPRGGSRFFATVLLALADDGIVLDCPARADDEVALQTADGALVDGRDDDLPVRFAIATPSATHFRGHPALHAPRPRVVERLQRREHFRVHVPMAFDAACSIPRPQAGGRTRARVVDLSVGGLALAPHADGGADWRRGEVRRDCTLALPGAVLRDVALEAVRVTRAGPATLGCRFATLDGEALRAVQRCVMALEQDRRRLA